MLNSVIVRVNGMIGFVFFSTWIVVHVMQDNLEILLLQALIWSKMSTGLPIEISSSMRGQSYTSFCRLDIDIHQYDSNMF